MSFMEMSHRDVNGPVQKTVVEAGALIRTLLDVPDNYEVVFQHGGAHGQFAGIPMNLAYEHAKIDFVNSGAWTQKAMKEASKYCHDLHICTTFTDEITLTTEWNYRPDAAYIHICLNETITGVEFLTDPHLGQFSSPATPPSLSTSSSLAPLPPPVSLRESRMTNIGLKRLYV